MRNVNVNRCHCKDCCIMRYSDSIKFHLHSIPTNNRQSFTSLVNFDFSKNSPVFCFNSGKSFE